MTRQDKKFQREQARERRRTERESTVLAQREERRQETTVEPANERARQAAKRRVEHMLDDIYNAIGDRQQLHASLSALVHADLAGGSVDGPAIRAASWDGAGGSRRTEHYLEDLCGARELTRAEVDAGVVPDWSVTVDPDPVGDQVAGMQQDQVHEMTEKATGYARDAAHALWALHNTLAAFMQLRDPNPVANRAKVRYCRCARHREVNRPPVKRFGTTVGDRLEVPADLCDDCYEAVRRTADSGSRKGRLPSEDEVRRHDRNGRWRITGAAA